MKLKNIVKLIFGFLALSFGVVGIVIPVWPTTPFVLLAVGCFGSTPKLRQKVLKIRFVREYHESYTMKKSISPLTLKISLTFLWAMLALSAILTNNLGVTILLLMVGIAVTIHILYLAKKRKSKKLEAENDCKEN